MTSILESPLSCNESLQSAAFCVPLALVNVFRGIVVVSCKYDCADIFYSHSHRLRESSSVCFLAAVSITSKGWGRPYGRPSLGRYILNGVQIEY
jgi:hypothetical protein